jgi:hypothetical protein
MRLTERAGRCKISEKLTLLKKYNSANLQGALYYTPESHGKRVTNEYLFGFDGLMLADEFDRGRLCSARIWHTIPRHAIGYPISTAVCFFPWVPDIEALSLDRLIIVF